MGFTDDEIHQKRRKTVPKSTIKCNEKWDRVFRSYLAQKNYACTEYWCRPDGDLDKILCKFWFKVRTTKPAKDDIVIYLLW